MRTSFYRISAREILLIALPIVVIAGGAIAFALSYMQPTPPRSISIATGGQSGAYFAFAKRYEQILARSGVRLDVRPSAGSLDNANRLKEPKSGVDAAFLQGGIATSKDLPDVVSVGRIGYEPLWIFQKSSESRDRLQELEGKRLAVGAEGSGTRHLALRLLEASGVTEANATLLPLGGNEASAALKAGDIDALFAVAAVEAPQIQDLLRSPGVLPMSLAQADAYTRRFPFLSRLRLPQGVIDLVRNIPPSDVALVAPSAVLVVRDELHPAIISLLAQAAMEVHQPPSLLSQAAEFPKAVDPEFQVSDSAQRYYKNGAPFFQRYLPFWLANLVERLIVLGVPLATVALPLFKFVPWLYRWRVRQRMLSWYGEMKRVESRLDAQPSPSQVAMLTQEIDRIEDEVNDSPVPIGFSEQFYNLRAHIDLVRQRLNARRMAMG